jgi:hypothetical protein
MNDDIAIRRMTESDRPAMRWRRTAQATPPVPARAMWQRGLGQHRAEHQDPGGQARAHPTGAATGDVCRYDRHQQVEAAERAQRDPPTDTPWAGSGSAR